MKHKRFKKAKFVEILLNSYGIKDIQINIPGFELDEKKSTLTSIVFKTIEKKLPKTSKELNEVSGYWIDTDSVIGGQLTEKAHSHAKNIFPTKELAEAALALAQLLQLRDRYNDDWISDWKNDVLLKFVITQNSNTLRAYNTFSNNHVLTFKTKELRDEFFKNFKDLLEIAKSLL